MPENCRTVRDAGWDGALRTHNRLRIIPGRTRCTILAAPRWAASPTASPSTEASPGQDEARGEEDHGE